MLLVSVVGSPRSQGRNAWQLAGQLRSEVSMLTRRFSLEADPRLWERLDDAAAAASRRIEEAFTTDRPQDFARLIRLSARGREAAQRAKEVVMGVEREWTEHLGPELADRLREGLVRLREVTDPYA